MSIFSIDLNNINLDHSNYDKDDPGTIIHIRLDIFISSMKY